VHQVGKIRLSNYITMHDHQNIKNPLTEILSFKTHESVLNAILLA